MPNEINVTEEMQRLGVNRLTPVEQHSNIWFKRDDLFQPFADQHIYINGGKARQALTLILSHMDQIVHQHNRGIMTATSVHSPQGVILSIIAKQYGLKCIIALGATKEEMLHSYPLLQMAKQHGAELNIIAKIGYNSVLFKRLEDLARQNHYFIVRFGMNYKTHPTAIFDTNACQVQNLPDDLDYLIIPVGSAISFAGILQGIHTYHKHIKKIIGVQVGANRSESIRSYLPFAFPVRYTLASTGIPYDRYVYREEPISLDPIYEAKAFNWMVKHLDVTNKKVCFWVIGNQKWMLSHLS